MNSLLAAALSLWILPASNLSRPWDEGLGALTLLPQTAVFVGEEHYTPVVQAAEAELIRSMQPSVVGWEFLTASEQPQVDSQLAKLRAHEIPLSEFFRGIPSLAKDTQIDLYLPIIDAIAETGAQLIALNAPRAIKRTLRKEGWEALPPEWQPPHFPHPLVYEGSYWNRFVAAMTGHTDGAPPLTETEVQSLYLAQFYTDEFMAWKASLASALGGTSVWIAGSFHMDYGLGFPARWAQYAKTPTYGIKLMDSSRIDAEGMAEVLVRHPQDGWVADAVGLLKVESE